MAAAAASLAAAPSTAQVESDNEDVTLPSREEQVYRIDAYDRDDEFPASFYAKPIREARTYSLPGRGKARATGARAIQRRAKKKRARR